MKNLPVIFFREYIFSFKTIFSFDARINIIWIFQLLSFFQILLNCTHNKPFFTGKSGSMSNYLIERKKGYKIRWIAKILELSSKALPPWVIWGAYSSRVLVLQWYSNSCLQVFYKIGALKNFTKLIEKHLCWSLW